MPAHDLPPATAALHALAYTLRPPVIRRFSLIVRNEKMQYEKAEEREGEVMMMMMSIFEKIRDPPCMLKVVNQEDFFFSLYPCENVG
jgi:hypothetical protein